MYISLDEGKNRKFCSIGKRFKENYSNTFDFLYNIGRKIMPYETLTNAGCGVANPRVRRCPFPAAALAISAAGVFEPPLRAFLP